MTPLYRSGHLFAAEGTLRSEVHPRVRALLRGEQRHYVVEQWSGEANANDRRRTRRRGCRTLMERTIVVERGGLGTIQCRCQPSAGVRKLVRMGVRGYVGWDAKYGPSCRRRARLARCRAELTIVLSSDL